MNLKHFFDPTTFEYHHTEEITLDNKGREKRWPNETKVPLPELTKDELKVKRAFIFDPQAQTWVVKEDHRGEEGFIFQEWKLISELGPLPENFTKFPTEDLSKVSIDEYKIRLIDQLDVVYTTAVGKLTGGYSDAEKTTFALQKEQATIYKDSVVRNRADHSVEDVNLLYELADGDESEMARLADSILDKSSKSDYINNTFLIIKKHIKKEIQTCTSRDELFDLNVIEKVREMGIKKGIDVDEFNTAVKYLNTKNV